MKYKAEELATKGGHSLNSWIVNVVRAATRERRVNVDIDLSSIPFLNGQALPPGPRPRQQADDRLGLSRHPSHSPSPHRPAGGAGPGAEHTLGETMQKSFETPHPGRCTSSSAPATS